MVLHPCFGCLDIGKRTQYSAPRDAGRWSHHGSPVSLFLRCVTALLCDLIPPVHSSVLPYT
jgi:hypothetical protein